MVALLIRVLVAVFAVIITFALIPPVCRILGFQLSADLWLIVRIIVGALALLYIWRGQPQGPPAF